jgi:hypothetical protein
MIAFVAQSRKAWRNDDRVTDLNLNESPLFVQIILIGALGLLVITSKD